VERRLRDWAFKSFKETVTSDTGRKKDRKKRKEEKGQDGQRNKD